MPRTGRHFGAAGDAGDEHPRFDFSYCPPIPAGWREFSWHNDAMPCWLAGPTTTVWVDYFDKELGDFPDVEGWKRYQVGVAEPPPADHPEWGTQHDMESVCLLYTDDWDEVLRLVRSRGEF